jgi:hypothetical protein
MKPDQQVAIWLHDKAAKLFLGLGEKHPVSRWVVVGKVLPTESTIGVWLDVVYVEERKSKEKSDRQHYDVTPQQCLIRWDYVITIQLLKDVEQPKEPKDLRPVPGLYL